MKIKKEEPRFIISARCLIEKEKQYLLVREKNENILETPGGTLKTNETPEDCAIREVKEETGLKVKIIKPLKITKGKDKRGDVISIIFLAYPISKISKPLPDIKEIKWVDSTYIEKMIKNKEEDWHDKEVFKMIINNTINNNKEKK